MKKTIFLFLSILISCVSFSQIGYGGFVFCKNTSSMRPYVNVNVMNEHFNTLNLDYTSVIGANINSLGNLTGSIGFDLRKEIEKHKSVVGGFSVEMFGMEKVNHHFMPSFRFGIEGRKIMILAMSNWAYKKEPYFNQYKYEPQLKPTLGVFYKFK